MAVATMVTAMAVREPVVKVGSFPGNLQGYLLSNDDDESDRLDVVHGMTLTIMERKLFLAPIGESPQRVIDIATGLEYEQLTLVSHSTRFISSTLLLPETYNHYCSRSLPFCRGHW